MLHKYYELENRPSFKLYCIIESAVGINGPAVREGMTIEGEYFGRFAWGLEFHSRVTVGRDQTILLCGIKF